jgi:hypothetical protein
MQEQAGGRSFQFWFQLSACRNHDVVTVNNVFGLCENGNTLCAGAAVLSSALSEVGAVGPKRACSVYWCKTLSVAGCGIAALCILDLLMLV